ncbi:MAG: hypothetical protein AB7G93_00905 [Bdellovibrionales bacterium]
MTRAQLLMQLKHEIQELMGVLSIAEIVRNPALIQQIEVVLAKLPKTP